MPVELGVQDLQPRLPSGWKAVSNEPTRNSFGRYRQYNQFCKLKFDCIKCKRSWSTMKGSVRFVLCRQQIWAELFKQECSRCRSDGLVSFYDEELTSLIEHVIEKYNAGPQPKTIKRTAGAPRSGHESRYCEACRLGRCSVVSEQS